MARSMLAHAPDQSPYMSLPDPPLPHRFPPLLSLSLLVITFALAVLAGRSLLPLSLSAHSNSNLVGQVSIKGFPCSEHGDAFPDVLYGSNAAPLCECHPCYVGAACNDVDPKCVINLEGCVYNLFSPSPCHLNLNLRHSSHFVRKRWCNAVTRP